MVKIAVFAETSDCVSKAAALAEELNLPLVEDENPAEFHLVVSKDYLGLKKTGTKEKPLLVDFLSKELLKRAAKATLKKELLARAIGAKPEDKPIIVDATAGLGRDSFILASLGFDVILLEKSPLVGALLQDGLKRAAFDDRTKDAAARMKFVSVDAVSWLIEAKNEGKRIDVIYLDPMFPERKKSALVKKNMQYFQQVIEKCDDARALFEAAIACASKRLVIKRPRFSPPIYAKPSFSLSGKSSRFDVYIMS